MKRDSRTTVLSTLLAVSGMLLIIWWLLLGLSQLTGGAGDSLAKLALAPTWVPINVMGLLSSLLLILGLIGILTGKPSDLGTLGFVGIVLSIAGTALFTAVQFDETFVWPLLARHADGLLEVVRTIGVVLLGVSLVWIGFKNRKRSA
jgi:hypothetical protein